MKAHLVDIECTIKHSTEKAVLVNDGRIDAWLPKNQIEIDHGSHGKTVTVTLPEWLAIDKELI